MWTRGSQTSTPQCMSYDKWKSGQTGAKWEDQEGSARGGMNQDLTDWTLPRLKQENIKSVSN